MREHRQLAVAIVGGGILGVLLALLGTPRPLIYLGVALACATKIRLEASQ